MGKFEFFEIVRVRSTPETIRDGIAGLEGAVVGKAVDDDDDVLSYAVSFYERHATSSLAPSDLEPTGRHDRPENFYDGTLIMVSQRGEARRRGLGPSLLKRLWARNRLPEDEAMTLALEAQRWARRKRR